MLQSRFIDGIFDWSLQQFLCLHARIDDIVTMVAKARQYMDAQEQAMISAIFKKLNVRFAATEDPSPDRIQSILDGLQKVLQTVLDNQNHPPVVDVWEQVPGNGEPKKGKGKGNRTQSPAPSNASTNMVIEDTREPEPRGRPSKAASARSWNDAPIPLHEGGRQGNQYPCSCSVDSQFGQPLQDRDQQVRGPRWNTYPTWSCRSSSTGLRELSSRPRMSH